jgi:hypothetical protein
VTRRLTGGRTLVPLGVLVVAASAFYAFVVPQTPARLDRPSADLIDDLALWREAAAGIPAPESGSAIAALLALVAILWLAGLALAVFLSWGREATRRRLAAVLVPAVIACTVSVFALPTASTDIFDYIAFGRVAAVHDANPYEVPPSAFPNDPVYPYASPAHRDDPDNKLPTWMLLNRGLAEVSGDDVVTNLLVYRVALAALSIGSLALVVAIALRVFPSAALAGAVLFGWNPVVVVYGASKTDTFMVFLFLLGVLALVRGRSRIAALPLALSVFVKLITLPLVVVGWLRDLAARRWRVAATQALVFAGVVALVYLPFGGLDLLSEHIGLFGTGDGSGSDAPTAAVPALPVVLAPLLIVVLAATGLAFHHDASNARLLRSMAVVAVASGLLLVNPNSSWYLMTLVAVTAIAADARLAAPAVAMSFGAFLFNSWQNASSPEFPLPELIDVPRIAAYAVPLALLGLAAAAAVLLQSRFQRGTA